MDHLSEDFVSNIASDVLKSDFVFDDMQDIEQVEGSLRPGFDSISVKDVEDNPDRLYKIGELAELLDLKVSVIREWGKKFSKFLRVKRTDGGHRLYTSTDLKTLTKIRDKYNEGYRTESIMELLKYGDNKVSKELLLDIQRRIKRLIFKLERKQEELEGHDNLV